MNQPKVGIGIHINKKVPITGNSALLDLAINLPLTIVGIKIFM